MCTVCKAAGGRLRLQVTLAWLLEALHSRGVPDWVPTVAASVPSATP